MRPNRASVVYVNKLREQYGLSPEPINNSNIRLIEHYIYEKDLPMIGTPNQTILHVKMSELGKEGAFFDPKTRHCFIKFNENEDIVNQDKVIETSYKILHEVGHKAQEDQGLQEYSFHLNEGFADLIAKNVMQGIIPKIQSEEDYFQRRARIDFYTPIKTPNGILYNSKEVMNILEDESLVIYPRTSQMQIIESLEKHNPIEYKELFKSALQGDPEKAKYIIESVWGKEISQRLSEESTDLKTLVDLVK